MAPQPTLDRAVAGAAQAGPGYQSSPQDPARPIERAVNFPVHDRVPLGGRGHSCSRHPVDCGCTTRPSPDPNTVHHHHGHSLYSEGSMFSVTATPPQMRRRETSGDDIPSGTQEWDGRAFRRAAMASGAEILAGSSAACPSVVERRMAGVGVTRAVPVRVGLGVRGLPVLRSGRSTKGVTRGHREGMPSAAGDVASRC
jgi:hypothetical protein